MEKYEEEKSSDVVKAHIETRGVLKNILEVEKGKKGLRFEYFSQIMKVM